MGASQTPRFQHVIIDVDSCLCEIEGIDELARIKDIYDDIAALTSQAMEGTVSFNEVFRTRLDKIRPTRKEVRHLGALYKKSCVPHARSVIHALRAAHCDIHLMSAGYFTAVQQLADYLGIHTDHVHANTLYFNPDGSYKGYDTTNPLSHNRGKRMRIQHLKTTGVLHGSIVIIGDGMSEIEAKPEVDLVIGYGGVIAREKVREQADVFISHNDFNHLLPHIMSEN